jgi:hypothetical protein
MFRSGSKEVSRSDGCSTDKYDSVTAVLVDLTDPLSPVQAAALKNALEEVRNSIPKYGRLEIYPLRPIATSTIAPLYAACSPGNGNDVGRHLYTNPEMADRQWRKQFADKVDGVVSEITSAKPSDTSPVLEGIQSVSVTAFGRPIAVNAEQKRLVIISDMIQYTSGLSMYQGAPQFSSFKDTAYYNTVRAELRGAKVDVYLIVRDTRREVQKPPLYKFWVEYISSADGYLRNWEPLQ